MYRYDSLLRDWMQWAVHKYSVRVLGAMCAPDVEVYIPTCREMKQIPRQVGALFGLCGEGPLTGHPEGARFDTLQGFC